VNSPASRRPRGGASCCQACEAPRPSVKLRDLSSHTQAQQVTFAGSHACPASSSSYMRGRPRDTWGESVRTATLTRPCHTPQLPWCLPKTDTLHAISMLRLPAARNNASLLCHCTQHKHLHELPDLSSPSHLLVTPKQTFQASDSRIPGSSRSRPCNLHSPLYSA
jgi:hypothetical protein